MEAARFCTLTLRLPWPRLFLRRYAVRLPGEPLHGGVMGELSPFHWLLVIAIALLLFGTTKFAAVGKGLGEGIRNFKAAMKDPEKKKEEKKEEEEKKPA
jgi:sec-independent protein translocase protein TatA